LDLCQGNHINRLAISNHIPAKFHINPNPGLYIPPANQAGQNTYVIPGAFDAGARFDGISRPNIPPLPPGVAPNAAQVAQAQGHNVVLGQKEKSSSRVDRMVDIRFGRKLSFSTQSSKLFN
jgi:hypothetical protein